MDELTRKPQRGPHHMILQRLLTDLQNHPSAWPFMKPVNREEVRFYSLTSPEKNGKIEPLSSL